MDTIRPQNEQAHHSFEADGEVESSGGCFQRCCCAKEEEIQDGARDIAEVEPAAEDKDGCSWFGCEIEFACCKKKSILDLSIDWRVLWSFTGPGWLMSIAYLDPGNLEADLQMGAYTGSSLIWVLFWSTVMGFCLQVMAARLGVVTGMDLAEMGRKQLLPFWHKYKFPAHILLWIQVEIAIIGSDIQEVLGSAIAWRLLTQTATYAGLPLWVGAVITALDTFGFLLLHYFGVRKLEAFVCVLIGTMSVCFFINVFSAHWTGEQVGEVGIGGVEPLIKSYALLQAVGTVGAVIMPHNLYLHSALVKTRNVKDPAGDAERTKTLKTTANKYFALESGAALFTSFLINLAVVAAFSRSFFQPACAEIAGGPYASRPDIPLGCCADSSAADCQGISIPDSCFPTTFGHTSSGEPIRGVCAPIGLENAGQALESKLGMAARYIWAIGLLAAGQASTLTGTCVARVWRARCAPSARRAYFVRALRASLRSSVRPPPSRTTGTRVSSQWKDSCSGGSRRGSASLSRVSSPSAPPSPSPSPARPRPPFSPSSTNGSTCCSPSSSPSRCCRS